MSSGAKAEPERAGADPGRAGRAAGIVLFWVLAFYVIGMSAVSIIPSLYWPALAPHAPPATVATCAHEISALDQKLLELVSESLHRHSSAELAMALHAWDGRSLALAGGCGPLEAARRELLHLRAQVGTLLRRIDRGPGRTQMRIQRAIAQIEERVKDARHKASP